MRDGLDIVRDRAGSGKRTRLVYIPTHRPFDRVLLGVADEINLASKSMPGDDLKLLLIDDRDADTAKPNHKLAATLAEQSDFAVSWLGVSEWKEFLDAVLLAASLSEDRTRRARAALSKASGSYAGGMNKAALIAAYLGAVSLHRRDSDELPGYRDSDHLTALQAEAAVLETPLPESLQTPYFAGSSVLGEPTKDHRDLAAVSPDLVEEIERISSRKSSRPATARGGSRYSLPVGNGLKVELDMSGKTEVGVSAMRKVHEWIPEMPAIGVLGTDHFQKGLLYQLGLPVAWHPLSATHTYDPSRAKQADTGALQWYVLAELRFCVLKQYWNHANYILRSFSPDALLSNEGVNTDLYASAFTDAINSDVIKAESAAGAFIETYERALALSNGALGARHQARVTVLRDAKPTVVPEVQAAIEEFASLARLWPCLIAAARAMRLT
jgi:hypothetical protein